MESTSSREIGSGVLGSFGCHTAKWSCGHMSGASILVSTRPGVSKEALSNIRERTLENGISCSCSETQAEILATYGLWTLPIYVR